jgi:adenylosuccinate lyase
MSLNPLNAISPIDGRYRVQLAPLADYFSERALIRYRLLIEVEYFIALCELPLPELNAVKKDLFPQLRAIYQDFSSDDAMEVKEIEKTTNHDVKAVEYFLKSKFDEIGLSSFKEFIHFGLTSQDINNTAIPLSLKDALGELYIPGFRALLDLLRDMAKKWADVPMLARTHGHLKSNSIY